MSNTVIWNHDLNIIEIKFRQGITHDDLEQVTAKAITLANEHDLTRFLVDVSEADLLTPLVDVYDLPDKRYDELGACHSNRLALIPSSTERGTKIAAFYEYVCLNRGWNVKTFLSREQAIKWLLSPQPGNLDAVKFE